MAALRRLLAMLLVKRFCFARSNYWVRKLVFCIGLIILLPFIFAFRYITLESTIYPIPAELEPVLSDLPPTVQQYVLQYKNVCDSRSNDVHMTHSTIIKHVPKTFLHRTRRLMSQNVKYKYVNGNINRSAHDNDGSVAADNSILHYGIGGYSQQELVKKNVGGHDGPLNFCPCVPLKKYKLEIRTLDKYMALPWKHIEDLNSDVSVGGHWSPTGCIPRQHIAIIIPYRNREEHLKAFVTVMHPFLQRQHLNYQIFVIEQHVPSIFNRASLMNIGFLEARKHGPFDCYIYHDVDLLPQTDLNFYTCYKTPLHIGAYMNKFEYRMPYEEFFGGAMALTGHQMETINGFPNRFYGWGGEDDDIYQRVIQSSFTITKHPIEIAKTYMIKHEQDKLNPSNPLRFQFIQKPNFKDGLNSIDYKARTVTKKLYTVIEAFIVPRYESECIIDLSLPASTDGNYLNCYHEENFLDGSLDCCHSNTTIFCCNQTRKSWPVVVFCVVFSSALFITAVLWRSKEALRYYVHKHLPTTQCQNHVNPYLVLNHK